MPNINFDIIEGGLQSIITDYDASLQGIGEEKKTGASGRPFGGFSRGKKGKFVENIAERLVNLSWRALGKDPRRLSFARTFHTIEILDPYIEAIDDNEIKQFLWGQKKEGMGHRLKPDVQVCIDRKFVMSVECKAYAENAMMKRIMVDAHLLQHLFPELNFVLFMLESQLGGDYSASSGKQMGSAATHAIMSYFPKINLNMFILLEGERKIDKPIHDEQHFKSLDIDALKKSIMFFASRLESLDK